MTTGPPLTGGLVTVVFTDVEGSTAFSTTRGDAHARSLLHAYETAVRAEVAEHEGRVVKTLGDGLMLAFASPRRAVASALAFTARAVQEAAARPDGALRLRTGIHTGEAIETGDDLHGAVVSAAARICARAEGDEVLVSDVVRQLCGAVPGVVFRDRGRRVLKGFPERWHLFAAEAIVAERRSSAAPAPFVGRERPRADLRSLLERAGRGRGALALVSGEPGVGKTRLVQELLHDAEARGWRAYVGHCHPTEGDLPYMPWVEVTAAAARALGADRLREALGEDGPAIARIVPELRRVLPDIPPAVEVPAEQQRWYIFNSVRHLLTRAGERGPFVLVLEDLHWADTATLSLLEHVADGLEDVPVLLVGTHREPRSEGAARLAATLARLVRRPHVRRFALSPFSREELGALVQGLSGEVAPLGIVDAIHAESDGNAFFAQEVFRHLAASGRLLDADGHFRAGVEIRERDAPPSLRLVLGQRLAQLGEPTLRMLGVAAVIGRSFSWDVLEAAAGREGDELLDAIEEAEQAQVVSEDDADGQLVYRFAHEQIRHTLLSDISAARRRRHHGRVADALEQVHAAHLDPHAAEIARHLIAAGSTEHGRIGAHLVRAGERALTAAAFEQACAHLEQALELLPGGDDRTRADVLVRYGLAQRSLRGWDAAAAAWDEALGMLERLGDTEAVGRVAWQLCEQLLWAYRFVEMAAVAARGLGALGTGDSTQRARLLAMNALALGLQGRWDTAEAHMEYARRLVAGESDLGLRGDVRLAETVLSYFSMRLPAAVAVGREAIAELRAAGQLWNACEAMAWVDVGLAFQGDFDAASAVATELRPLAERLGHWGAVSALHRCAFAATAAQEGDLDALDRLAAVQFTGAVDTGNAGQVAYSHTLRGIVAFWRGRWDEAEEHLASGVRLAMAFWAAPQRGYELLLHAARGDREAVHRELDALAPLLPVAGRPNVLGAWTLAVLAAEAVGAVGGADRARELHGLVQEALATGTTMRQLDGRLIETSAGMVAGAAGRPAAARGHFERALEQAERLPHRLERPFARHAYGRFLLEHGEREEAPRAGVLLTDAVREFQAAGLARHEAQARKLLERGACVGAAGDAAREAGR